MGTSCCIGVRAEEFSRLLQGPLRHAPPRPCSPLEKAEAERLAAPVNDMLARVQARLADNVELMRPIDYLCDKNCPVFRAGHWLYWDLTHFTLSGSAYMIEPADAPIRSFLLRSTAPIASSDTRAPAHAVE
ncbi:SGNH hydrolase domain-containing protein [Bradyrhizobium diazoefficiens]